MQEIDKKTPSHGYVMLKNIEYKKQQHVFKAIKTKR